MPDHAEMALRIFMAMLLGSVVGLERELTGQTAGLRTHLTVALGAALFGIVSAYGFTEFIGPRNETNYQVDPTRVASNIVTGVGFLGGGAIIKHGASVRGLTTAASMWVTAAIGLAVGLGGYFEGALATVALVVSLSLLRGPRRWLRQRFATTKETVIIRVDNPAAAGPVIEALQKGPDLEVRSVMVRTDPGHGATIEADVRGTALTARLAELSQRDDVSDIDINS